MARLLFVVLGAFLVLTMGGFVVAFGSDPMADPLTTLRAAGWLLAGGLVPSSSGVEWYRLVGVADVLMGLALAAPLPVILLQGDPADAGTLVYNLAAFVGGLTLAFIGVDWYRGGRHFDLSRLEGGPASES